MSSHSLQSVERMQSRVRAQRQPQQKPFWRSLLAIASPSQRSWHGGIELRGYKELSNATPVAPVAVANIQLAIPLERGRRSVQPCVQPGQHVRKGEVIGIGDDNTPWVHASTSGIVERIDLAFAADSAEPVMAVILNADGLDEWIERPVLGLPQTPEALVERALQMGIVGLGGAGFPTALKLAGAQQPDLLLINGAECEPFLTCDDRLMRERAEALIEAADYVAALMGVTLTRFGIETNKPQAMAALRAAARQARTRVEICPLPARYPAGGQPLMIKSLSGRNLAPGTLPADIGVLAMNVATLYALGRAIFHGEPLVRRVLTLTGDCERPGNVLVPVGYPVSALRAVAGAAPEGQLTQVGGPMMGQPLPAPTAVISKTSSCLIFGAERYLPAPQPVGSCIRCTRCVDVCPMSLRPLDLYAAAERLDKASLQELRLDACIECGSCSSTCPSNLPLRERFRQSKTELRA
ncbi:electron transport complex subunit RsxC [Pseudomonas azerbaijanorientalis]|uniref:electron transport complex subunit RsxC n=1 Tax=Pseudomonas azerbaijanorientalis TaxID=2842350 RepID=UPI001C3CC15C|nr:electron transport complex subunit RsxC [Pseudomonas azerbaijanorientalis]QXH63834.1 electron transport complex subunit RsxC [Pseudomonas azerbaijanorientalis]